MDGEGEGPAGRTRVILGCCFNNNNNNKNNNNVDNGNVHVMQVREEVESRVATAMQKAVRLEEQLEAAAEAHVAAVRGLEQQISDLRQQLASRIQQEASLRDDLEHAEASTARSSHICLSNSKTE